LDALQRALERRLLDALQRALDYAAIAAAFIPGFGWMVSACIELGNAGISVYRGNLIDAGARAVFTVAGPLAAKGATKVLGLAGRGLRGFARAAASRARWGQKLIVQPGARVHWFKSFGALKRALGSAGRSRTWHHIVEQRSANVSRFGAEAVHNTLNVGSVPRKANQILADYYSSVRYWTGGRTVRRWLDSLSWREQFDFGLDALNKVLSGGVLP